MNKYKTLIIILIMSIVSQYINYAQVPDKYKIYKQLISKYGKISSISMNFDNMGQSGSIKAKTGNKYLITMGTRQIICNGKYIWMKNKQNVIINDFHNDNNENLTLDKIFFDILSNLEPTALKSVLSTENGKQYLLELKNKNKNKNKNTELKNINLYLNDNLDKIVGIEVVDKNISQKWNISNLIINKSMQNKMFEYTPSKDIEVIDMRQ